MERENQREKNELRPVKMNTAFTQNPTGSVLYESGNTIVFCTAMVEEKVPPFLKGSGKGWVTAEYSLLPASTDTRTSRESSRGKVTGRTSEIQRLIGRSLRAVMDMKMLGERTVWIDCDVLQADGGTRTAAITGGFVVMYIALQKLKDQGLIKEIPVTDYLAAISVGVLDGELYLDLDYKEDFAADVDMNIVMTASGEFIEVQGTAEEKPFSKNEFQGLLELAEKGIMELIEKQKEVINNAG